jgi:hypothetical protein
MQVSGPFFLVAVTRSCSPAINTANYAPLRAAPISALLDARLHGWEGRLQGQVCAHAVEVSRDDAARVLGQTRVPDSASAFSIVEISWSAGAALEVAKGGRPEAP